jgi:hypothetical protein
VLAERVVVVVAAAEGDVIVVSVAAGRRGVAVSVDATCPSDLLSSARKARSSSTSGCGRWCVVPLFDWL